MKTTTVKVVQSEKDHQRQRPYQPEILQPAIHMKTFIFIHRGLPFPTAPEFTVECDDRAKAVDNMIELVEEPNDWRLKSIDGRELAEDEQ